MDNRYDIMVHFLKGVDPIIVIKNILNIWKDSNREQLYVFNKIGDGISPTEDILRQALTIGEKQSVYLTMKSSKKKDADKVELYFSNPSWKIRQTNVCTISLSKNKIENCEKGYDFDALVDILSSIVNSGPTMRGFIEANIVIYENKVWEIETAFARKRGEGIWPFPIYWITFLPVEAVNGIGGYGKIEGLGLQVVRTNKDGSCIIWTKDYPYIDYSLHIAKLININSSIKI